MYRTVPQDTFLNISRATFGDDAHEVQIRLANPGLIEPMDGDIEVIIPEDALQLTDFRGGSSDPEEILVYVNGNKLNTWDDLILSEGLDKIGDVKFTIPFDLTNPTLVETFRPLAFQKIVITVGLFVLFTGNIYNVDPRISDNESILTIQAYATPGVLFDCTVPSSFAAQTEFLDQNLQQIAESILRPYGIPVEFISTDYDDAPFSLVSINVDEKIGPFLSKLARQRRLVVGSDRDGKLIFRNDKVRRQRVGFLSEGKPPLTSIKLQLKQREYFSHISGFENVEVGRVDEATTVRAKGGLGGGFANYVRPRNIVVADAFGGEMENAVNASIGRMYANVAAWSVQVPTWFDDEGVLWEAGQEMSVLAPTAFIIRPYSFTVRKITFSINKSQQVARMDLMFPNAFAGEAPPDGFPWDDAA